jgi:hypothetical protein
MGSLEGQNEQGKSGNDEPVYIDYYDPLRGTTPPPSGHYHPEASGEITNPYGAAADSTVPEQASPHTPRGNAETAGPDDSGKQRSRREVLRDALILGGVGAIAAGAMGTGAHYLQTRHSLTGQIERDYRGENFVGQDSGDGCLDGTPYEKGAIDTSNITAIADGPPTGTIHAEGTTAPDLVFIKEDGPSADDIAPANDYTRQYTEERNCP